MVLFEGSLDRFLPIKLDLLLELLVQVQPDLMFVPFLVHHRVVNCYHSLARTSQTEERASILESQRAASEATILR